MNILLDYMFPISSIIPTPAASTAFLKQACVVAKPKDGGVTPGIIHLCTTMAQVNSFVAATAAAEVQQLFNAGMNRVFILPMNDLDLANALEGHESDFFTILVSSDFAAADVIATEASATATITNFANLLTGTPDTLNVAGTVFTAQAGAATPGASVFQAATSTDATAASLAAQINAHAAASLLVVATALASVVTIKALAKGLSGNVLPLIYVDNGTIGMTLAGATGSHLNGGDGLFLGAFKGVTGVSSTDDSFLSDQAAIERRVAFHTTVGNKAKNMFYAFGKLLSNALNWSNQQYITMPFADDIDTLGEANALFDDKVNFVISDDEFSNRLALFAAGGKAIVAPYIERNLQIDIQSKALQYISGNQPAYTKKQAALLEDELQKVVNSYIQIRQWIEKGTIEIELLADNFVGSGFINIAEPKALWRIFAEMRNTL